MARGFESKDVEYQQAEAQARHGKKGNRALTPEEREAQASRPTLELALTRTRADLASATSPAHRRMLDQAIAALEEQIRAAAGTARQS
ncbi:MAG: hypothetical protein DMF92_00180 [Acidobacteria bacterium]|nr:MAG: hypothetical protein DMF92_00180 [Acidobacteriota bacterium]